MVGTKEEKAGAGRSFILGYLKFKGKQKEKPSGFCYIALIWFRRIGKSVILSHLVIKIVLLAKNYPRDTYYAIYFGNLANTIG